MSRARVSRELTEVRTVHSRATTALVRMDDIEKFRGDGYPGYGEPDPEVDEIREVLHQVVALTERFARPERVRRTEGTKE